MANPEKKPKVSQKETAAPDPKGHEGEIWHKPFSYKTKAGVTIKVAGHWERRPASGSRPKQPQALRQKAAKKVKEGPNDRAASTAEAEADA
jgi:hypothetical protein